MLESNAMVNHSVKKPVYNAIISDTARAVRYTAIAVVFNDDFVYTIIVKQLPMVPRNNKIGGIIIQMHLVILYSRYF
jgi:hypothetical protein